LTQCLELRVLHLSVDDFNVGPFTVSPLATRRLLEVLESTPLRRVALHLSVPGWAARDKDVKRIIDLPRLLAVPGLTLTKLHYGGVSNAVIAALASAPGVCEALEELVIFHSRTYIRMESDLLTDLGIQAFVGAAGPRARLRVLVLQSCWFVTEQAFALLHHLPLEHLDVSLNRTQDEVMGRVSMPPTLTPLRRSGGKAMLDGVLALCAAVRSLRRLDVVGMRCVATSECVRLLVEARPELQDIWLGLRSEPQLWRRATDEIGAWTCSTQTIRLSRAAPQESRGHQA
jgi:hypothetical protein